MQLGLGDIGGDLGNIEGTSIFGSGRGLNWVVREKIRNYANEVAAIPSDSLWKASVNQITQIRLVPFALNIVQMNAYHSENS